LLDAILTRILWDVVGRLAGLLAGRSVDSTGVSDAATDSPLFSTDNPRQWMSTAGGRTEVD